MNNRTLQGLAASGIILLAFDVVAGVTNTVPWWDSFESYTNGTLIAGTNGWRAETAAGGVVTTDALVTAALSDYPTHGRSYPLPAATHSNVLQVASQVSTDTRSATGGIVAAEFLVLPTWMSTLPDGDTNLQYSLCVSTNGRLTLWHHNTAVIPATNQWLELTNSPAIPTNAWTRFSVVHDYSNRLFQVRVNEGDPVADGAGWTAGGATQGGSWFHMVQTNALLAGFNAGGAPVYLDDLVVTNRCLVWSGDGFVESVANDGSIASTTVTATLTYDTFTGTNSDNLAADGRAIVTGVPPGLTAQVQRVSATQVSVVLTHAAHLHESANSISNLAVSFASSAFALGNAWDVAGSQRPGLTVTFLDTPRLSFSTNRLVETAANDGSLDNASPLTVWLTNGTFNGSANEDFATNAAKVLLPNLPAGLTAELLMLNASTLRLRLLGQAVAHNVADDLALSVQFRDAAFAIVPAASVFNAATNVNIVYTDPSVLTYGTSGFNETPANDGSVGGTTLLLTNRAFNAGMGDDLVAQGKVSVAHLPDGLGLQVCCSNSTLASLVFTGRASLHAATNSIGNLGITFGDGAFVGGNAAGVSNAVRHDLSIQFSDQPVLAAAGAVFNESAANDGSIGNTLAVSLSGDTFVAGPFSEGVHYSVANVPAGLSFSLTRVDATHAVAALGGNASSHAAIDSIADLRLTFLDAAFASVGASNVTGHALTFSVAFTNAPVVTYGGDTFTEVSGGYIDNRSPLVISLAGGTLGGADGQDFVATGWLQVGNLPQGLTAQATRDNASTLSVRLAGSAAAHASSNSVHNVTFAFQNGAFGAVPVAQVRNASLNGVSVVFVDDTGFFNVMPYVEPFEAYANGTLLAGTNGWSAAYFADAAVVTNGPDGVTNVLAYLQSGHAQLPYEGTHARALLVQDYLEDAIHSETAACVYVDFMTVPVALQAAPEADTNLQYAFYVSTNSELVVWHKNRTGPSPVDEWMVLSNAPAIGTSAWTRFTITHDYAHSMFQVQVNESRPIADSRGWTAAGAAPSGSWYYMVQTNGSLSALRMSGVGAGYLDDLSVQTRLPDLFGARAATLFKFR